MAGLKYFLLFALIGIAFADTPQKAPTFGSATDKPKTWFNFWETSVVGNLQSSGGQYTEGPQAGGGGVPGPVNPVAAPQGGAASKSNSQGWFNWFQNSAVDPNTGGSSTNPPPVNGGAWAHPNRQMQAGHQGANQGSNYYPSAGSTNQNSGEVRRGDGRMAGPGMVDTGMAAGANPNQRGNDPNMPYNANGMQSANAGLSASSGSAAGTLVGVVVAVLVVVAIFGGVAYFLTRQRRNNHVIMASV